MTINQSQFSEREKDVAKLLLRGKSNKQIALELGISSRTVEFHLGHIYAKLRVSSRIEAILKLQESQLWKSTGTTESFIPVKSTVETYSESSENGFQPISRRIPMKRLFMIICGGLMIIGISTVIILIRLPIKGADITPTLTYPGNKKNSPTNFYTIPPVIPSATSTSIPAFILTSTVTATAQIPTSTQMWASKGFEGKNISSMVVDPSTPTTLYAAFVDSNGVGGVFKSIDSGQHWRALSNGMPNFPVYDLKIDPSMPTILYAATDHGVFKSTDGGESFYEVSAELSRFEINVLAIDPVTSTTLYAGTYNNGLFKSMDGGRNWSAVNPGFPRFEVCALAIDPSMPAILYAGTFHGVLKSMDGGVNWSTVNISPIDLHVCNLAIDPKTPLTVYAAIGDINHSSGVMKTVDGGLSWSAVNTGLDDFTIIGALVIDSRMTTTIYVGTQKYDKLNPGGGVIKSMDGGGNWFNIGLIGAYVNTLAIAPTTPSIVYAGTNNGVFSILQVS
jgi:DNA-binding CsgD family transcriptional regulator/photosystem II stability/assembly factor-like uncharacterized protein